MFYLSCMITETDFYFMQIALREAEKAFEINEVPVGAVIVINNQVIAKDHNRVEQLNDSTAHAEMLAITSAYERLGAKYLVNATLYVTLEPCLMCCGALYWSKLSRIVFGAADVKNGYQKWIAGGNNSHPFHPKTSVVGGVLAQECADLMKLFFQQKR